MLLLCSLIFLSLPMSLSGVKCKKCRDTVVLFQDHIWGRKEGNFISHTSVPEKCWAENTTQHPYTPCVEKEGNNIGYYIQIPNTTPFPLNGWKGDSSPPCPDGLWFCIHQRTVPMRSYTPHLKLPVPLRQPDLVRVHPNNHVSFGNAIGGDNLFVDLATKIAGTFNVTNCWVCGGPRMSEQWPWWGEPLNSLTMISRIWTTNRTRSRETWSLSNVPSGFYCLSRAGKYPVGESPCKAVWIRISPGVFTWFPKPQTWFLSTVFKTNCLPLSNSSIQFWNCTTSTITGPYQSNPVLKRVWERGYGVSPNGLFWVCGNKAYTRLPSQWSGTCFLGIIRPEFFLLPHDHGHKLGVKIFDTLHRAPRSTTVHLGEWRDDWPPERIIQYYGPATWAQDGSWGYRTPIYMLNRIIRLQAVLEIVTNQTAIALQLLASQQGQMRSAIYQNRLALDYLLATEGSVCGKLNLTNCCLQIDDNGKAVRKIADNIRTLSHVPVQTWHPFPQFNWMDKWFGGTWWRTFLWVIGGILFLLLILPCIIPCLRSLVISMVEQAMQPGGMGDPVRLFFQREINVS
ncbi:endogenous retrovirus group 3 member 1 Env polyprotein-like [Narcine bancroftii]|uniref:endogenous retrovirus group 3 member 1 Env polyprotein-like n=1 Tax=Narcine bancroftii TaxID=1343680 RepID=UPI00383203EC